MVNGVPFPDEVRRFILTSIPSVPYLEAMLMLRIEADAGWDGKALAKRLYMAEKAAEALLDELHAAGVLLRQTEEPATYRYDPESEELRQKIDALAVVYSAHLVEVANLIHSKTSKKAQQFADAFKW